MFSSRTDFIRQLGLDSMPAEFATNYSSVMEEFDSQGVPFLSDEYLDRLQTEFALFPNKFSFVKEEAKRIREDDLLARYSLLLKHMLADKDPLTMIKFPEEPSFEDTTRMIDLEMAGFFAELAFIPQMVDALRAKCVPEHIICQTLNCFETGIIVCNNCFDRDGYEINRSFWWNQHYISGRIINVGVLYYEIRREFTDIVRVLTNGHGDYKILSNGQPISSDGLIAGSMNCPDVSFIADFEETDDGFYGYEADPVNGRIRDRKIFLPKTDWFPAIAENDAVINIHIPEQTDLTVERLKESFAEAKAVFDRCYPDFQPKAFTCFSWLMDPKLRELLGERSKIVGFQSLFMLFPRLSNGNACFKFLFRKPFVDYESLPEKTSLQKKVKQLYLEGGCIYDPCGLLFFDQL